MKLLDKLTTFYIKNEYYTDKSRCLLIFLSIYFVLTFCSTTAKTYLWSNNTYLKIASDVIVGSIIFSFYMKSCKKQDRLDVWPKRKFSIKTFIYILSFFICMDLVSITIMKVIYTIKGVENPIIPGTVSYVGTDIDTIIRVVLIGPIIEELIFRGAGLRLFKKKDNKLEALLFTSIFFGLAHANLAQAINSTLAGFVYGYVAIEFGLIYAILFHILNNGLIYMEYFLNIAQLMNVISIVIFIFHILSARKIFEKLKINLKSEVEFSTKRVLLYFSDIMVLLYCIIFVYYVIKSIV